MMNSKLNTIAEQEAEAVVSPEVSTARRVLIAFAAVCAIFLAAPVGAQAVEGLSFSNTVSTNLNGQTLNFGSNTQLALPVERTIFLWSNTSGTNRRYGVNINLTGTAYEFNRLEGGTVAASRTCFAFAATPLGNQVLNVSIQNTSSSSAFKSCGIVLRLKAGLADNATYDSTISYSAIGAVAGCSGGNCIAWSGGSTQSGNGSLTGTVVANINSGEIQNTAGNAAQPSYDYGSNGVGTSTPYTFTLRNTGNTVLTNANSQTVTGVDPGDFVRSSSCPATLAPNATCTIQVSFEPSAPGARTATLNVNSGNAGTISSALSGTGLVPTFIPKIQDTAGASDLTDYAFVDPVPTGEPFPPSYTFTLRNEGNSVLEGTNIQAITGVDSDDFSRSSNCPVELNPNATCQITITFSPNDPGAKAATLEVNTSNGGTVSAALTGTAVAGVFETTIQNTAGDTGLPSYAFPDTIALASNSYVFTIRNTGNVNLQNVGTQTITGDDADQFSRSTSCGAVLAPGATCTVTVNYNPNRVEAGMTATLNVDPSNGGSSSIPLTATSLTPTPVLSIRDTGDTLDLTSRGFTANLGSNQAYVFTVKNTGDSLLNNVNTQSVTGTHAAEFTRTSTCGATLLPGASCTTTVTFAPQRAGTRTATLNINPSNPIVSPAAKTVALVGEATGISIRNDVTDNIANTGSQKRWLESVSLAPGGTLPSDTVRVAFEVDAGTANEIAGVDIVGNMTTNDTAPSSNYQDIASLTLGNVSIQRKPGSNQALVVARVPLSSTAMGVANGSFGFSTGTDIVIACLGGSFKNTNRRLWFRVRGTDGSTSATVGSVVRMHNQQFACPNNQGPNLSNQRILTVGDSTLPNNTTEAAASKNEGATFQFNTRAKAAGALGGSAGTVDGINWRIRNVKTGDIFRIVNGTYTTCADPCTADANFTNGARFNFTSTAAGVQQLTIPGIPSRGRWVVEASPQGSDENNDSFFHLGTLRINDRSGNSPTLTFDGTLGLRPNTDADYTISATVADPADPVGTFDSQGGKAQVIEWDLNGITTDGADGDGFEIRAEADSSSTLDSADLTKGFSTTGKTPGPYKIRARVTDNGASMAAEADAVSRIFEFDTTINTPPVPVTEEIFFEADRPQPSSVEFKATDVDSDDFRVAISPDGSNNGTLGGGLNGPVNDNSKNYTWPSSYTGSDTFDFVPTDEYLGIGPPGTVTVKVRPDTTIDSSGVTAEGDLSAAPPLVNPDMDPMSRFLGSTVATGAAFDFSSPQQPVVGYECRLLRDNPIGYTANWVEADVVEDWSDCDSVTSSPTAATGGEDYNSLQDGLYRFEVRAVNDEDVVDGTPAFRTWRIDSTAPVTEVRVGPTSNRPQFQPRFTSQVEPTYILRNTDAERTPQNRSSFECRVLFGPLSGEWKDCGTPTDALGSAQFPLLGADPGFGLSSPFTDGAYQIEFRSTDEVGNLGQATPETLIIDTVAPQTALASGPEGLVNSRELAYVISSTQANSTFDCRVVGENAGVVIPTSACPGGSPDGSKPQFTVPQDDEYILTTAATDPATNRDTEPLEVAFEVDATTPGTSIESVNFGQGATELRRTQSRSATVGFTGEDQLTTTSSGVRLYQCRLDSASETGWKTCQSPERFGALSDGSHRLEVRSVDNAGNPDSAPEVLEWVVDRTPPVTTITQSPDPVTNNTDPVFAFAVNEPGSTSVCSLDDLTPVPCTSPVSLASLGGVAPLADGPHQLTVASTDLAGNAELASASVSWEVDTTIPAVEMLEEPAAFTPAGKADFGWLVEDGAAADRQPSEEADSECRFDSGEWQDCGRSFEISAEANSNGPHTFSVRATDQAGNTSPLMTRAWEVRGVAPVAPTISASQPENGATTRLTAASISFGHPEEGTGVLEGLFCQIDSGPLRACVGNFAADALADGAHQFRVVAKDIFGNVSPAASVSWEVQSKAPATTINSGPSGLTRRTDATVSFSSSLSATFECRIDGAPWASCTSPVELTGLTDGVHSVRVRSVSTVSPVGVKDPTPPIRTWTVDSTAPDVSIDSAPTGLVDDDSGTVEFSSTDPDAEFQCKVGTEPYDSCESPLELTGLSPGQIIVLVRAIDPAGNLSASEEATWDVKPPSCPPGFQGTPPNCTRTDLTGPSRAIDLDLTGGSLSLASLGAVPLEPGLINLPGRVFTDNGALLIPQETVNFDTVVQTIPDVLGPGTVVSVEISISATGDGLGTLPAGGGPASLTLPVRADVQAKLGSLSLIPAGTECALNPVTFDLSGSYDQATGSVSLSSTSVAFPKITGCATFKDTIDDLLELPRSDISIAMDFGIEEIPDATPARLSSPKVLAPRSSKSGKSLTLKSQVKNTGQTAASNTKVCLKSPASVVKGAARRCQTVSIAAGATRKVSFTVATKAGAKGQRARFEVSAEYTSGGRKLITRTGHVTLMR